MNGIVEAVITIGLALTSVAIVAAIVSKNSQAPAVIQAGGSAFGNSLGVALSPVTGQSYSINLGYPNQSPVYG